MKERVRIKKALYGVWTAGLVAYAGIALYQRTRGPLPNGVLPIHYRGDSLAVHIIDGENFVLFRAGKSFGVVFVSARCKYCRGRASDIVAALERMPVDHRILVSLDDSVTARSYRDRFVRGGPAVAVPLDHLQTYWLAVRAVPTFVVVDSNRRLLFAHPGLPGSSALAEVRKALGPAERFTGGG